MKPKMQPTTFHRLAGALCLLAAALPLAATAQPSDFPSRPIRIVVPAAPGGATDNVARSLAKIITEQSKATVVIENKPGASGSIGIMQVVNAKPDGYTLVISAVDGVIIYPLLRPEAPYRHDKDLTAISLTGDMHFAYAVNAGSKFKNLKELIEASKTEKLSYATPGAGTSGHMCVEMLKQRTGAELLHVPYGGAAPAMMSVVAGETDLVCTTPTSLKPFLAGGKLRALGNTNEVRTDALPGVPTMLELGYKDFVVHPWNGIFGPRGMDASTADRLNQMINDALNSEAFRRIASSLGMNVQLLSRAAFEAKLKEENDTWGATVRSMSSKLKRD